MVWRARNVLGSRVISDYLSSESSEGEFVEEEKPWPPPGRTSRPPKRTSHIPRPHSHLFRTSDGRRARGNKHARRWENCMHSVARDECFYSVVIGKERTIQGSNLTLFLSLPHLQLGQTPGLFPLFVQTESKLEVGRPGNVQLFNRIHMALLLRDRF